MEYEAIKRIEELTAFKVDLGRFIPATLIPAGCKVESLEHLQQSPAFMRATYTTERLEDFCRYVSREAIADNGTVVFIKPDGSGATGIIDFGSHGKPLWGRHKAQLAMVATPEFRALTRICSKPLTQRDLLDWIEDWQHIISPFDSFDGSMLISAAVQRIQRIDIKTTSDKKNEVGDFKSNRTAMEQIEATSGTGAPPSGFYVACQVYPCTKIRDIQVRMSIRTTGDEPVLMLRMVGIDAVHKEVAEEVDLEINTRFQASGADVRTFVGSIEK